MGKARKITVSEICLRAHGNNYCSCFTSTSKGNVPLFFLGPLLAKGQSALWYLFRDCLQPWLSVKQNHRHKNNRVTTSQKLYVVFSFLGPTYIPIFIFYCIWFDKASNPRLVPFDRQSGIKVSYFYFILNFSRRKMINRRKYLHSSRYAHDGKFTRKFNHWRFIFVTNSCNLYLWYRFAFRKVLRRKPKLRKTCSTQKVTRVKFQKYLLKHLVTNVSEHNKGLYDTV